MHVGYQDQSPPPTETHGAGDKGVQQLSSQTLNRRLLKDAAEERKRFHPQELPCHSAVFFEVFSSGIARECVV